MKSEMANVRQYQESHLSWYLRAQKKNTFLNRILRWVNRLRGMDFEGEENLPEQGPFLVITNHFGGETSILLGLLASYDVHIVAGEELNWKRSCFRCWIMRKLRMISIKESLSLLSEEEKERLLERVPENRKKWYYQVARQAFVPDNTSFVQVSLALLSRGDVLVTYPEGLFLYEKEKFLHQGYRGIELIARYYEQLTGQELPIVPIVVFSEEDGEKKKVRIGKPLVLSENHTELSGTDWCMIHLVQLLPENQRGYYK